MLDLWRKPSEERLSLAIEEWLKIRQSLSIGDNKWYGSKNNTHICIVEK